MQALGIVEVFNPVDQSLELLLAEVASCMNGRAGELPEPMPYRNHVAQALAQAKIQDARTFFRSKLSDIDEPTGPFGVLDVHQGGSQMRRAAQTLTPSLGGRLRTQMSTVPSTAARRSRLARGKARCISL